MNSRGSVDFNCDLGEDTTPAQLELETRLMAYVTSVNIACGGHAGDVALMRRTVRLAHQHGLAIGAHPGLPDRENRGRREQPLSPSFVQELVLSQVGALMEICREEGVRLSHVKPHGALYNMAARDRTTADAVAAGVVSIDRRLILIGLAGSELLAAGRTWGLAVAAEGFADRAYHPDGRLVSRDQEGAVIHDVSTVIARTRALIRNGMVQAVDGSLLLLPIDTLCLHGDTPDALHLAQALRRMFDEEGFSVRRLDYVA